MPYCLVKPLADRFRRSLKDGTIDPAKLLDMSSKDRRAFFSEIVGEANAKQINALFESKLLLKNVERGLITWAKTVSGIRPAVRQGLIDRIQKMDPRILESGEGKQFFEDLASKRMGTEVTQEEAADVMRLTKALKESKKHIDENPEEYGAARVELENYIADVKRENNKIRLADFRARPVKTAWRSVKQVAGIAKSLKATLDVSGFGRQGFTAMIRFPATWGKNVVKSFGDIWQTLKKSTTDDSVMNAIKAEIYARENSRNNLYKRMKLAIGTGEEAYPSSMPEKIPVLGRMFKASEVAYTGFLMRLRADLADAYLEMAKEGGIDLQSEEELKGIGNLVNSMTGRASLGRFEGVSEAWNVLFFAPKNLVGKFHTLTSHALDSQATSFSRKEAAKNLIRTIGVVAAVLASIKALWPDAVEEDPRSSDFGKVRIGDSRFDITGGLGSLFTLASRIAMQSSKSSTSGNVMELGTKYGQTSPMEVFWKFTENKFSPFMQYVKNEANRSDFSGKPLTLKGRLSDSFVPLPIANAMEALKNPNSAPVLLVMLADAFGFGANTYSDDSALGQLLIKRQETLKQIREIENAADGSVKFTNWDTTTSKELQAFREEFGESDETGYGNAKERYAVHVQSMLDELMGSDKFKAMDAADRLKEVNKIDEKAKDKVFKQFNWKYKKP